MKEIIAYHGTDQNFDGFKLPETLENPPRCSFSWLGIYFSESKKIGLQFAKENWTVKKSPYKKANNRKTCNP